MRRLKFLDGLRGWGAVFVVLFHVFSEGLPVDPLIGDLLKYLFPFNGMLAVIIFFIVSGFSLSVRYLAEGDIRQWLMIAAGRYLRLAIPVFAACFAVHLVMVSGLVAPATERLAIFSPYFNFAPTVGHLLKFSLFDVFFHYEALDTYIGPLWTMSIELAGSFVVLLAILAIRPLPGRPLFLLGLAGLIFVLAPAGNPAMLSLFPVGAALADGFNRGWTDAIPRAVAFFLVAVGCLVPTLLPFDVWSLITGSSLTLGCIAIPPVRAWLSGTMSAHLGKISFPLYLTHGPVLCFVGEPLMRHFGQGILLKVLIDFAVVILSFASAYAFLPINELAIRAAHRFARSGARLI